MPYVHRRPVKTERGEERFHDHRRAGDDEAADDRQLAGIGITASDRETAADDTDRAEDKPDEHHDTHRFAGAFGETASLREQRKEVIGEKCFHVATFYRAVTGTLLRRRSDSRSGALARFDE